MYISCRRRIHDTSQFFHCRIVWLNCFSLNEVHRFIRRQDDKCAQDKTSQHFKAGNVLVELCTLLPTTTGVPAEDTMVASFLIPSSTIIITNRLSTVMHVSQPKVKHFAVLYIRAVKRPMCRNDTVPPEAVKSYASIYDPFCVYDFHRRGSICIDAPADRNRVCLLRYFNRTKVGSYATMHQLERINFVY